MGGYGGRCFVWQRGASQCGEIFWPPISCRHSGVGGRGGGRGFCSGPISDDQCHCKYHDKNRATEEAQRYLAIKTKSDIKACNFLRKDMCDNSSSRARIVTREIFFEIEWRNTTQASCLERIETICATAADPNLSLNKSHYNYSGNISCLADNTC